MLRVRPPPLFPPPVVPLLEAYLKDAPWLRLVLMPSVDDVSSPTVYPQPPMEAGPISRLAPSIRNRITLLSNPSTFVLNGIVFAANSVDVLMHLNTEAVHYFHNKQAAPDRMANLAGLLLEQQHFYPLYPPKPGVPLDLGKGRHLHMPVRPDVLLLTSKLKAFTKALPSTLAVNCGKLTRAKAKGCYATLSVVPADAPGVQPDAADPHSLLPRMKADIVWL